MPDSARVLLFHDDEPNVRNFVAALAAGPIRVQVKLASTRATFVHAVRTFAPTVVVVYGAEGRIDALDALAVVRQLRPVAGVIVTSDVIDEHFAVSCIRAGAEDVVATAHLSRLAAAVESARQIRRPLRKLSPRQVMVLRLIAEGNSTPAIARHLEISVKTAGVHRTALMKRLGLHDVVSLVRYAIRVGLVQTEKSERGLFT